MKFISDDGKMYSSLKECEAADKKFADKEKEVAAKKAERQTRAKAVSDAFSAADAKYKEANELLKQFNKDYGAYHISVSDDVKSPFSLIDDLFDHFFF